MAVLDVYVIHIAYGVESDDLNSVLAFLASNVLDVDITYCRRISSTALLLWLIVEIDLQHRFSTLAHFNISGVKIFYNTSSASIRLNADYAIQVWTVHLAVLGKHVTATARDLTS